MSSAAPAEAGQPHEPTPRKRKIGRARKLEKRVEEKADGRYLIYYEPARAS